MSLDVLAQEMRHYAAKNIKWPNSPIHRYRKSLGQNVVHLYKAYTGQWTLMVRASDNYPSVRALIGYRDAFRVPRAAHETRTMQRSPEGLIFTVKYTWREREKSAAEDFFEQLEFA